MDKEEIAMHLLEGAMKGGLLTVPSTTPIAAAEAIAVAFHTLVDRLDDPKAAFDGYKDTIKRR